MDDNVIVNDDVSGVPGKPSKKRPKKGSEDSDNSMSEVNGDDEGDTVVVMIKKILSEMRVMRTEMVEMKEELRKEVGEMIRSELNSVTKRMEEMKSEIKEDMKSQQEEIENLKERMDKSENDITNLNTRIEKEISTKNKDLVSRLDTLEQKSSHVSTAMKDLAWKTIDYESRMRRNNLLFYGIGEERNENCTEKIEHFLKNILNVNEPVAIQRAHRLGKPVSLNSIGKRQVVNETSLSILGLSTRRGHPCSKKRAQASVQHL